MIIKTQSSIYLGHRNAFEMNENREYPRPPHVSRTLGSMQGSLQSKSLNLSLPLGRSSHSVGFPRKGSATSPDSRKEVSPKSVPRRRKYDGATWIPPRWKLNKDNCKAEAASRIEAARQAKLTKRSLCEHKRQSSSSEPQSPGTSDNSEVSSRFSSSGLLPIRALLARLAGRWNSISSGEGSNSGELSTSSSGTASSVSVFELKKSKNAIEQRKNPASPVEAQTIAFRTHINSGNDIEEENKVDNDIRATRKRIKTKISRILDVVKQLH